MGTTAQQGDNFCCILQYKYFSYLLLKKTLINGKKKITTNLRIYHDNYILYYIRNYKFDINFSQVIDNSYFLFFVLYTDIKYSIKNCEIYNSMIWKLSFKIFINNIA